MSGGDEERGWVDARMTSALYVEAASIVAAAWGNATGMDRVSEHAGVCPGILVEIRSKFIKTTESSSRHPADSYQIGHRGVSAHTGAFSSLNFRRGTMRK